MLHSMLLNLLNIAFGEDSVTSIVNFLSSASVSKLLCPSVMSSAYFLSLSMCFLCSEPIMSGLCIWGAITLLMMSVRTLVFDATVHGLVGCAFALTNWWASIWFNWKCYKMYFKLYSDLQHPNGWHHLNFYRFIID